MDGRKVDMANDKENRIHAPYNFVPFANKPISRYETIQDLPSHDKIDPNLKTGEIHVQLKAETPIYIGGDDSGDFFKGTDGTYQIPGSSVRGMLRENMQILSMGVVRADEDLEDYQIYFRDVASSDSRVSSEYKTILGVEKAKEPGKNIHAGYLCNDYGEYYIKPSRYYRVSRKTSGMSDFEENGVIPVACYRKVAYTDDGSWVRKIVPLAKKEAGMKEGVLLSTGKPVSAKPNSLYVIENVQEEKTLPIRKEDILSYEMDLKKRKNGWSEDKRKNDFWDLPEKGQKKAVFYVEYNGHIYFGMSLFLRVGYPHKISDGLPPHQKEAGKNFFLDYPHAIMGFATENFAYRSRISVGDFKVTEIKQCKDSVYIINAEPKPSYYAGYLKDPKDNKKIKSYIDDDFILRGYKRYWMKEESDSAVEVSNGNMKNIVRPLEVGTVFKGVIRYKNLHEDELGLLLWALTLEKECYQSLGMGKPYGMGRVNVIIEEIKEINVVERYTEKSFFNFNQEVMSADMEEQYIKKYKECISARLNEGKKSGKPIEKQRMIENFFFIHQVSKLSKNEMTYMSLKEFKKIKGKLAEIEDIKEIIEKREEMEKKEAMEEKKMANDLDCTGLAKWMRG